MNQSAIAQPEVVDPDVFSAYYSSLPFSLAMTKYFSFVILVVAVASTAAILTSSPAIVPAFALMSKQSSSPSYSDLPSNTDTAAAVQELTERGVVQGYSNGQFRPNQLLNRAEYLKIVMELSGVMDGSYMQHCFPDVPTGSWYESYVCRAKTLGIVQGNPPPASCTVNCVALFNPTRNVNYVEALKILSKIYAIPVRAVRSGEQWYAPYMEKANDLDISLTGMRPGDFLTRGDMALLASNFLHYVEDNGSSSSRSSSSSSRSSSSSSRFSSSSSRSSVRPLDPLGDTTIRSQFVLLGEISPILGAATFFSDTEPLNVTRISVDFGSTQSDIMMLLFYDQNRQFIGTASVDTSVAGRSTLRLAPGTWSIPRRTDSDVYVRARLRSKDEGGVSNAMMQISQFVLEGNGAWSGQPYTQASTETFDPFVTSRSAITNITNAGPSQDLIISGPDRTLAAFRFQGRSSDSSADLSLTTIIFSLTQNNVTLSNVELGADGTSTRIPCSVSSTTITCTSINDVVGSITDGPRTLTLYGDLTIINPSNQTTYLQVSLNNLGTATTSGNIAFSDTSQSFQWVPLEVTNVNSTRYSY